MFPLGPPSPPEHPLPLAPQPAYPDCTMRAARFIPHGLFLIRSPELVFPCAMSSLPTQVSNSTSEQGDSVHTLGWTRRRKNEAADLFLRENAYALFNPGIFLPLSGVFHFLISKSSAQ